MNYVISMSNSNEILRRRKYVFTITRPETMRIMTKTQSQGPRLEDKSADRLRLIHLIATVIHQDIICKAADEVVGERLAGINL